MMKQNKISVAVIGGGINSAVGYAHYCAMNLSNRFHIITGCFSKNKDTNLKTAEAYFVSIDKTYDNYKTMLHNERSNIDAVVILTPSNQHTDEVIYAMEIGIPVICEKALTTNLNEVQQIKSVANNQFISVVYNYICYPMLKELKNIISKGELGKIVQVQIEMQQEGFLRLRNGSPAKPQSWRLIDGIVPTISLDLGTHTYSIVKFLTGETPIEVVATQNSFGNFKGIIDDVNAIIKYSNDLVCNMWYSKTALGSRNGLRVRVYGSKGSAEWFQCEPEYLKMADNSGKIYTIDRSSENVEVASHNRYNRFKVGHPAGFIECLANFYEDTYEDLMKNDNENRKTYGLDESEECMKLLEGIAISAKNNCWKQI